MKKTTARISEENHKELLRIQGEIQSQSGEFTTMDNVIEHLIAAYRKSRK